MQTQTSPGGRHSAGMDCCVRSSCDHHHYERTCRSRNSHEEPKPAHRASAGVPIVPSYFRPTSRSHMFETFTLEMIALPEATLRVRYGDSGPSLLLLHGHPRTHTTWYRVAPLLARHFTVICPDLRGFDQSSKPSDAHDFIASSKREGARLHRSHGAPWLSLLQPCWPRPGKLHGVSGCNGRP
jgi:hypothetical protein